MVRHHWISLGIAAVWTLFVLPWFTSHILAWGFISFILLYAFLDVGHARTFRGRPNIKGQDTVLITGNWWQNGHIGLELAKLYARDGFHVMFAALLYNSNIDNKRSETEQLQLKNSDQQLIKDKFKLIQGDLVRINSNIRTHLSIIPFIESFNLSSRTASSSDDKQLNSFDLMSSIENACQSICHGDTDLKGRFRITHLVNCGGALNLENSTMLRDNSINIDQQLKWLKVYNESLVLFCHYFGKYFREQRLKYPRFDYYILNIGNLDGFAHHIPSLALSSSQRFSTKYSIYHAMESFIQSYSVSLHEELKAFHIHVSCLNNTIGSLSNGEGTVEDTEMSSINSNIAALRSMTPLEIAKIGYRALFTRSRYTIPGYFNYLIGYMWLLLPLSISSYLFPSMFKSTLVSPTGTEFVAEPAEVSAIVASSTTPKEKLTISSGEKPAAAVSTDAAAVVVSPVKDDVLGFKKLDKNALEGDTFGEKASIVQSNNISRSSISTF